MTVLRWARSSLICLSSSGRVHDHHERVTVTVHGRPAAVLIAPEDLEALEETLEHLQNLLPDR
jgi:prevent-host-death family protein